MHCQQVDQGFSSLLFHNQKMNILVEFSGGLELLFGGSKKLNLCLQQDSSIKDLLQILKTSHIKERPELFLQDQTMYSYFMLNDDG